MIKLKSTIIYNPGALVRIRNTNKYGLIISLHEECRFSYTYNILPLNTSIWRIVRLVQLTLIKKLLN